MIPNPSIKFDLLYLSGPIKVQAIAADHQSPAPLMAYASTFGGALFRDAQCMIPLTDEDIAEARAAGRVIIRLTLADDSSPVHVTVNAPAATVTAPDKVRLETPRLEVTGEVVDHCDSGGTTGAPNQSM